MKINKKSAFYFDVFAFFTFVISCCCPLFYLYIDDMEMLNGFKYFVCNSSWNILMICSFVFLLLGAFFSLLACLEQKIYIKRKSMETGLTSCIIETFLYTLYALFSLQDGQTTLAPFSLLLSFSAFTIYNIINDSH